VKTQQCKGVSDMCGTIKEETESRELLLEAALCAIMELTDEEKKAVLSKYAERYGWDI
jgi:hypothetical protein